MSSNDDSGDLYKQLIDSHDLVRELDDIEAISQQISQHAEVLYQNWKTSKNEVVTRRPSTHYNNNNRSVTKPDFLPLGTTAASTLPASSSSSSCSSSSSAAAPLELLASPEVNGQLKDLVKSFVSTDRAKQAARQTITSTLTSHLSKHPNKNGNNSSSSLLLRSSSPPSTGGRSIVSSADFPSQSYNPHRKMPTIFSGRGASASAVPIPIQREEVDTCLDPAGGGRGRGSSLVLRSPSAILLNSNATDLHAQNVAKMRQKFEDTKKQMLLSHFRGLDHDHSSSMDDSSVLDAFRRPRGSSHPFRKSAPPHPELTPVQKQHIFERSTPGTTNIPIRRFASSGSVAERVLIFEKCPVFGSEFKDPRNTDKKKEVTSPKPMQDVLPIKVQAPNRTSSKVLIRETTPSPSISVSVPSRKSSLLIRPSSQQPPPPKSAISSKRGAPAKEKIIPRFHFPFGNPAMRNSSIDAIMDKFQEEFRKKKNQLTVEDLGLVLKACGAPYYWKRIVFIASGGEKRGTLSYNQFSEYWRRLITNNHDEASQFLRLLTRSNGRAHLLPEDFVPLVQDVVDTHPGLGFLKDASEFHSRYVHTVIARIYFCVNRSWSGQISITELRRSHFLTVLRILEEEDDINQVTDFFSYEHFYVIYCKFWELDKDHDLFIDREDLCRHNDQSLSTRMIDRIFCGTVTRGSAQKEGKMSYTEFVWFLLAEEDKRSPTSIEYWFRCMDLDGDGYLSLYELEYFYEEQLQRMEQLGIETLPFEDCLCQMLDMIGPKEGSRISLRDLKACRMTPIFFDTFFNLEKYLDHEQRDPFASQRDTDEDGNEMSDWDRFAAEEYELLVAEEGNPDEMCCEDEMEPNPELQLEDALDNDLTSYQEPMTTVT